MLNKGGKVSFSSLYPGRLGQIEVEMGWDAEGFSADDVDASCFMLGENGKAIGDEWFVFYNQPFSPDRSIMHEGKRGGEKKEKIVGGMDFSTPSIACAWLYYYISNYNDIYQQYL